jgi:hypothetical protein
MTATRFVAAYQARVADDVDGKDHGEAVGPDGTNA